MAKDLAQRVAAQRTGGTDVAESQSIEAYIRQMQSQFALAMPRGAEASQLVRDALTMVRKTPKLAECERASVLGGLMTCAQLGLRVGVLGHAWLLPFRNKGRLEAQLIIGYQGYKELAYRSGLITSTIARRVHEHDTFDVDYGLADNLIHKPKLNGDRGPVVAYYAIGKTSTGGHAFVVVSKSEMEAHRDRFAMAKFEGKIIGPWRDNFDEMAEKTCFLQVSRWLPRSTELAQAIAADGTVRVDITPTADPAHVSQVIAGEIVEGADEAPADEPGGGATPGVADGQPAGELVSEGDLRKLNTALSKAGYRKRDERLTLVREVTGRGDDLESTKDLTASQAAAVMERLEQDARAEAGQEAPDAASDPVAKPDTDSDRAQLVDAIAKAAHDAGVSLDQLESRAVAMGAARVDALDDAGLSTMLADLRADAGDGAS